MDSSEEKSHEVGLLDDLDEVITAQQQQPTEASRGLQNLPQEKIAHNPTTTGADPAGTMDSYEPFVRILVQPQSRALRFRYKCEGRYPGALTGVGTTNEVKTYPQIKVENYEGKFVVVISCVTKDRPHYPHPHNIVSKEACKDGVYSNKFDRADMTATFTSLGIQCVKKTEVLASLEERLKLRIDPFKTNYEHRSRPGDIDLNAVRLCFQVFIEPERGCGRFTRALKPVVSEVIFDRKAMSDLQITKLSHSLAPLHGGLEMILLCDKVSKEDIEVYFYQEDSAGNHLWEEKASIVSVHKQVAVCFRSPSCSQHLPASERDQLYAVKVHLRRSRVNELGEGRDLYLLNSGSGDADGGGGAKRKRSGADQNVQMQAALLAAQMQQDSPMVVGVPRYSQQAQPQMPLQQQATSQQAAQARAHEAARYAPSPHSDESPAPSPQQWAMQPLLQQEQVVMVGANRVFNNDMAHDPQQATRNDALVAAGVNEAAEKLDSLDISIPSGMSFITSSDINLNNLNIAELQMSGPTATPVLMSNLPLDNSNIGLCMNAVQSMANGPGGGQDEVANLGSNLPLPGNFSESMFESGASINQLDLLNSGQLRQLKQEEE